MKGTLQFSPTSERWHFVNEEVDYDLHCGEVIEMRIGGRYYVAGIELGREGWYVILHEDAEQRISFVLMRNRTYATRWLYT